MVLKSVHPSPLSAARGFFDCGHFKETNEWLRGRYGVEGEIDWNLRKVVPIKAPGVEEPVKATVDQKAEAKGMGSTTEELPEKDGVKTARGEEDFGGDEDEDAIEALEALADSSVVGKGGEETSQTEEGSQ